MSVRTLQPTSWLARRLGLSVSTIERLRARGDQNLPPHVVIGPQSIRYDEEAVEAWIAARMRGPDGQVVRSQPAPGAAAKAGVPPPPLPRKLPVLPVAVAAGRA